MPRRGQAQAPPPPPSAAEPAQTPMERKLASMAPGQFWRSSALPSGRPGKAWRDNRGELRRAPQFDAKAPPPIVSPAKAPGSMRDDMVERAASLRAAPRTPNAASARASSASRRTPHATGQQRDHNPRATELDEPKPRRSEEPSYLGREAAAPRVRLPGSLSDASDAYFADPADGLVASTAVPTFLFRSPVSEAVTAAATSSAMATPEDKRMPQPSLSGIAGTFATPQRPSMAASDKFSPALSSAHRRPIWEPREEADALGRRSALERAQASKARRRATSDLGG